MRFTPKELAFLAAWAREEKAQDPYSLPAHQLQALHKVRGVMFIRAIKAWAQMERRRDEEIFEFDNNPHVPWPWVSDEEMMERLTGAAERLHA